MNRSRSILYRGLIFLSVMFAACGADPPGVGEPDPDCVQWTAEDTFHCDSNPNGSYDSDLCECVCEPGWTGRFCDMQDSENCDTLECVNGFFDEENCFCICEEGYTGTLCDCAIVQCIHGYFDDANCICICENEFLCQNMGLFKPDDCSCICPPGWTGAFCQIRSGCEDLDPETVQGRLCAGETPKQILASDPGLLDSLYGKRFKGGLIYEVSTTENICRIAAINPTETGMPYGCYGTFLNIPEEVVYNGFELTFLIFDACGATEFQTINGMQVEVAATAAAVCILRSDLEEMSWHLPSIHDFELMQANLYNRDLGHFKTGNYWTINELNDFEAFRWDFSESTPYPNDKSGKFLVQPVMLILD